MSTALADIVPPVVTAEQLDLVKRTVANGATDSELKLFLHDCARRGVHPLDKLLHFTKRDGRYTPITSIDFMRSQAAATGEMAGSDDPTFLERESAHPDAATVTVYRLTQGQRFAYTATARWSEYCPDAGASGKGDRMWRRMPHTMLGKCAEALALRKAFPQQLAGLYAREELDQADVPSGYSVDAPVRDGKTSLIAGDTEAAATRENGRTSSAPTAPVRLPAAPAGEPASPTVENGRTSSADSHLYIARVDMRDTKNANVKKYIVVLSDGRELTTIKTQLGALAEQCCQDRDPVRVETKTTKWGDDLMALTRVTQESPIDHSAPVTADEIPF